MKTQHKKQKSKQKTKSNPREEVIQWVKEFVEVPHPMFADYPPCPYAKQARMQGKVDFRELTDMEPDSNIWTSIDHFDFEKKDVLVIIADAKEMDSTLHTEIGGTTQRHIRTQGSTDHGRPPQTDRESERREAEPRSVHFTVGATQDQTQAVR